MQSLSIVIPAYNEQDRLGRTLSSIADAWKDETIPLRLHEIIIADDGSRDSTIEVAESWKNCLPVRIVRLPKNKGKGAAMRAGVYAATGDLLLMYDADGAAPIAEVAKLLDAMQREAADIAIGSRVLGHGGSLVTMSGHRRLIGRVYHGLCSALVPGIYDTACGCKLFKTDVAKRLFSLQTINRFAFDVEVLMLALWLRYNVTEVPVVWTAIPESKVRLVRDGVQMLWSLLHVYARRFAHLESTSQENV